jgi:hypothetical protein
MPKSLKDILNGVKTSVVVPGSTGDDPGVDYAPKAPNEQEFVKLHKSEKHADRVGNEADIYQATNIKSSISKETRHGRRNIEDSKKVNEEAKCNGTNEGTACPIHEMDACPPSTNKKSLKEIIKKKTSAGEIIRDFIDSKNPKFAGKSTKERQRMALGAYYSMHPEKSKTNEDLAVPLLGSHDIAKHKTDDTESEIEMVKTELKAIANKAMHMIMSMQNGVHIETWVQSKIASSKQMISDVHDYMVYGEHEEDEQTAPSDGGISLTYPNTNADNNAGAAL